MLYLKVRIAVVFSAICLFCFTLVGCKKVAFYDDQCTGDCYVISGTVIEDSSGLPLSSVTVLLEANDGIFVKQVVETHTDDSGYWKASFDSDYIENISDGTITYSINGYLYKKQNVTFNSSDLNVEKSYSASMHKSADVFFNLSVADSEIKRIQARYYFDGHNYMLQVPTNEDKPLNKSFIHSVPANKTVSLSLWYSLNSNQGDQTNWIQIQGFPVQINLGSSQVDTVDVNL